MRMTAVAWAVIAAREVENTEKRRQFERIFESADEDVRAVVGYEPLFFCPTTKLLVDLKALREHALESAAFGAKSPASN